MCMCCGFTKVLVRCKTWTIYCINAYGHIERMVKIITPIHIQRASSKIAGLHTTWPRTFYPVSQHIAIYKCKVWKRSHTPKLLSLRPRKNGDNRYAHNYSKLRREECGTEETYTCTIEAASISSKHSEKREKSKYYDRWIILWLHCRSVQPRNQEMWQSQLKARAPSHNLSIFLVKMTQTSQSDSQIE